MVETSKQTKKTPIAAKKAVSVGLQLVISRGF